MPFLEAFDRQMTIKMPRLLFFTLLSALVLITGPATHAPAQEAKKILSIEAYDMLNVVPDTYLIDVRTRAEYQFVGHPINAYLFPYLIFTLDFGKDGEVSESSVWYENWKIPERR